MAKIIILADNGISMATLSRPDEDGDYVWTCSYGHRGDAYRPIDEAVADAEVHVDIQCGRDV
jgi:hypothetical protein